MIRRYWRNGSLVLLCALVCGALFRLGLALEMDRTYFSFRYLGQNQVAAALSSMVPGQPFDYMTNTAVGPVATKYWTEDHHAPLSQIVDEARQAIEAKHGGGRGWVVDDKGYVDWLRLAFRLFGFHKSSVYYTYFILLGFPMVVYAAYFFRSPAHLFVLLSVILAIYVTAPILVVNDQLYSLHEQRFFSVVGLVPLLTLLFIMREAAEASTATKAAVAAQVAALVFVYHCRNDSVWQTLVLAAAVPVFFWRRGPRHVDRLKLLARVAWPVGVLAAGFVSLEIYRHIFFNRAYFAQGYASHSYSHNLIMGFSFNPRLARQYDLAVNDQKVVRLVGRRMVARGALKSVDDAVWIFNNDFNRYSAEVRSAMVDIIEAHPVEAVLSIPYKGTPIYEEYRYVAGYSQENRMATAAAHRLTPEPVRRARGLYYRPFAPVALATLALGAWLAAGAGAAGWRSARLAGVMVWIGSLIVPLSSIPMMYILGPAFVTTAFASYVLVVSTMMIAIGRFRA